MGNIGPYLVGVAFWIFVAAAAVAGIVSDYKRRHFAVEVLRMAIDKGQQLDPALIDKLWSHEGSGEPIDPVQVKLGGIITIASGIGVGLLSFFINPIEPRAFYPILGIGTLAVCVGIGLLVGARALAVAQERERLRHDQT